MRKLFGTTGWTAVLLAAALCISVTLTASAAPLWAEVVTIREPDGSSVEIKVWGDEFYSVGETLDGYTIVRDGATGLLSYAELSADGTELVSTGVAAGEPAPQRGLEKHIRITPEAARAQALAVREDFERRASGAPLDQLSRGMRGLTIGDVVGITLIVDFSDDVATIPPSDIDNYCNDIGYTGYGNNGSVREYFLDVSEGLLNYTNFVPTHYFRAPNTKAYYCDPIAPYGQRARQLVQEALQDLDDNGFDFSQYDSDGDGIIDAVNCFYAGDTWNAWAEGLWPHAYTVTWCGDGVCTHAYQITNLGSQLRIGTFCHENGHMLMGWPDLYDYDYDSTGVGRFCIMCYGTSATNPCEPCAYMKYDAGWGDVTVLTNPQGGLEVPIGTNVMYKFEHPELPNEYYLVENRQRTGRDVGLPDDGLAIWHVDTEGSNNNQQQTPEQHYLVTLVQADGRWDMENNVNYGDGTDLYAATRYPECSPVTYPNTDWWDRSESGAFFMNISTSSATMTLDFHNAAYVLELASSVYATEIEYYGTALYTATLKNWAPVDDTATVEVGHDVLPDGVGPSDWTAEFREAGGAWQTGPSDFVLGPGEEKALEVRVIDTIGTVAGMAVTTLSAQSSVDPQSSADISFGTFVEAPSILIVDDDGGESYETYLETALADAGYGAMTSDAEHDGLPRCGREPVPDEHRVSVEQVASEHVHHGLPPRRFVGERQQRVPHDRCRERPRVGRNGADGPRRPDPAGKQ
jgi:M6 family metalloprotease-like protein